MESEHLHALNITAHSDEMPAGIPPVAGIEWNDFADRDITVAEMVARMKNTGFQATAVAEAAEIIDEMIEWRKPSPTAPGEKCKHKVFLGFTSNLVSSGLRSTIRFLVEHDHIDAIVATAGAIEEDIIKILATTYRSTFHANDPVLRLKHINRIGNLLVPNDNYCLFEDWLYPVFSVMLDEQEDSQKAITKHHIERANLISHYPGARLPRTLPEDVHPFLWTPSAMIARFGKVLSDMRGNVIGAADTHESIVCQAFLHNVPIYCPAITDGSIGDMLYQFNIRMHNRNGAVTSGLVIDIARDVEELNMITRRGALHGAKLGAVILGGGLVKHHIMNACLQGGGADAAVYINTAVEYDGSDSGARPSEAISWGKIKAEAKSVKVYADATVVFPLIVAATWAKKQLTL